jgi:ABC-2 type transport system permease protein
VTNGAATPAAALPSATGRYPTEYYTPAIAAYGVMSACFVNVALTDTFRREAGLLKKTRGTALPAVSYFGGLAASAVVNAAIIVALIITVGVGGYGASLPRDWAALIITLAVGAAAFCALALAVTTFIPNFDAAPAVVNLVFLVLLVISGGFFPIASSSALSQIADIFPLRHLLLASFAAFAPSPPGGFPWWHVAGIAAWGAAGFAVACVTSAGTPAAAEQITGPGPQFPTLTSALTPR